MKESSHADLQHSCQREVTPSKIASMENFLYGIIKYECVYINVWMTLHVLTEPWSLSFHLQSAFLRDCFFFDGLEITLIRLLLNTPISCPFPKNIFTVNIKCFLLSESDI